MAEADALTTMKSELFDALMKFPVSPELLQEAQEAFAREQVLRAKFYADVSTEQKWEFIQGEVIVHAPVLNRHLVATQHLYNLLNAHVAARKYGQVRVEKAMTSFPRNDFEPDIMFFALSKSALIHPDTLRFPVPDLIVEVTSPSTEARDRGIKFQDYGLHGVREYWIVDPVEETVELYRLQGEAYPPAERQKSGTLRSDVVPGFEISVRAVFDETENLTFLRKILGGN